MGPTEEQVLSMRLQAKRQSILPFSVLVMTLSAVLLHTCKA